MQEAVIKIHWTELDYEILYAVCKELKAEYNPDSIRNDGELQLIPIRYEKVESLFELGRQYEYRRRAKQGKQAMERAQEPDGWLSPDRLERWKKFCDNEKL